MSMIWTPAGNYSGIEFESEAELEKAIATVARDLFGPGRIYLDVKKKIGKNKQNIPDAYLLDLSSQIPRLYVVENELSGHHPTKHIAVQLLEFSLAFDEDKNGVRNILVEALNGDRSAKKTCEAYVTSQKLHSIEDLIHKLVFETEFSALVIIDEESALLETILSKKLNFSVEVIELSRYENENAVRVYSFEPFLAGLASEVPIAEGKELGKQMDVADVNTIVVPARLEGFKETFLNEKRWYAVRIHASMKPYIKYIAAYQVAPVSAITYLAEVQSIEPWQDTHKFVLNFSASPQPIGPIKLQKDGKVHALQAARYTNREKLKSAKTLDDAF